MNAAIQQRVDEFVREIVDLVERARGVSMATALSTVAGLLADAGLPPVARGSSTRRSPASGKGSRKAAPPPRRGQGPARGALSPKSKAATPVAAAPSSASSVAKRAAGPARSSRGAVREASETAGPPSAVAPASASLGRVPEREARVLDALRALGRATASEVAARTGQPNGSVAVALRALVARGQVARTTTDRGVKYSVPATTAAA